MGKRILIISPTPTHPPVSGNRARILSLISSLRHLGHVVHFLHIGKESGDGAAMKQAWGECYHEISYHMPKKSVWRKLCKKMARLLNHEARFEYSIDEWWDPSTQKGIVEIYNKYDFDVVIVEYIFFSKALTYFPSRVLKLIDTHDVFTKRHKMFLKNNLRPKWFSTTARQEKIGLERADLILAIQDKEKAFFSQMTQVPVITVGHLTPLLPPRQQDLTFTILYVASNNLNNQQSIMWFIDEVFAKILQKIPQVRLLIAGTICGNIPDFDNVDKLGIVDDLGEVYQGVDIVINPMLYGTGLKIKNVEALGYSKVLVTTPVGAEGMEDGVGTAFLVASGADEFAECLIKSLSDPELHSGLARSAYDYALKWNESILETLEGSLENMAPH